MRRDRDVDVLIAGYFGFGNLGDETILRAAVECLNEIGVPRDRICVLSNTPECHQDTVGIKAVNRWKISSVVSALQRSKTLLFPGGGIFQDATSIRSLIYYWALVRASRICGCRPWALGQSVGPILTRSGRVLATDAVMKMEHMICRDMLSSELLTEWGLEHGEMPDTCFALSGRSVETADDGPVLFNVRPVSKRNRSSFDRIIRAAEIASSEGAVFRGIAMSEEDEAVFPSWIRPERPSTFDGFVKLASGCSFALGMRLHFAIFSYMLGLPAVVSSYDPKVEGIARQYGLLDLMSSDVAEDLAAIKKTLTNQSVGYNKNGDDLRKRVLDSFRSCLDMI